MLSANCFKTNFFIFPGRYSCRAATVTLSCSFKPSGYAHFSGCTYKGSGMTGENQQLTFRSHHVATVQLTICPWECFVVVGLSSWWVLREELVPFISVETRVFWFRDNRVGQMKLPFVSAIIQKILRIQTIVWVSMVACDLGRSSRDSAPKLKNDWSLIATTTTLILKKSRRN